MARLDVGSQVIIQREHFGELLEALQKKSYKTIGPTLREKAIVYEEIESVNQLPVGWTEKQEKGKYRLVERSDGALFGYNVGPQSWKSYLSPPEVKLWSARKTENGFEVEEKSDEMPQYAFIGVRPCDLSAINILDRVFLDDEYQDNVYGERRKGLFIVAVNCTEAGNTCFCSSMGTGPRSREGYDLAITEIIDGVDHFFVTDVGTENGAAVLEEVTWEKAGDSAVEAAEERINEAADSMGRDLDTDRLRDLLFNNFEHPQWHDVAERCLSCANCTMVCPTCFCHTVEEVTDLEGDHAERWRIWDSCFTLGYSYIHGGSVRKSTLSRYRQWMTHKLASWHDQFGTSGCVGCGRCITWCPVGIDITEETAAIRKSGKVPEEKVDQPQP